MSLVQYNDQLKTVPEGFRIVQSPDMKTMTLPKLNDKASAVAFFKPLIDIELANLSSKDPYLDSFIILTHILQESNANSRNNNSYPARGLGQFIPATQASYGILDPYNYGDQLPKIVTFVNANFKHYSSIKDRDLRMSCGVMAYFSGRRTLEGFKRANDELLNLRPLEYLHKFEVAYRGLGGQGFKTQW